MPKRHGSYGMQRWGYDGGAAAFSPSDLADLELWLKADAGTWQDHAMSATPAASDGDVVGGWEDQSGNGNDVIQATTAKKPTLQSGGGDLINGLPVIRFDGVDDLLRNASAFLTGTSGAVFIVYRLTAELPAASQYLITSSDEASTSYYIGLNGRSVAVTSLLEIVANQTTTDAIDGSTAILAATTYIAACFSSGTAYTLNINGAAETVAIRAGANDGRWWGDIDNRDSVVIGALKRTTEAGELKGDIGEILVYDGATLNAGEIASVETYLADRWGVTIP